MTHGELLELLSKYGLRPIHGRSQNFLLNDSAIEKLVAASGASVGTNVLEIGPGPGILTAALLSAGASVTAVEIDPGLCRLLRDRFGNEKNFRLIEGDALEISNVAILESFGGGEFRVAANLPYAITSPVLMKFLFEMPRPESITMMIQKEVAERIVAKPKDMSSLAVACQVLGEPKIVTRVSAGSFYPVPSVDSAVIHIRLKSEAERQEFFHRFGEEQFFQLVRQAFAGRRKQLKNTLKNFGGKDIDVENCFNKAKISPSSRPEELTPEDWRRLAEELIA